MFKLVFIFLISSLLLAQSLTKHVYFIADTVNHNAASDAPAVPEIGWKELCNRIIYPARAVENNIETSFDIYLTLDSLGNVENVRRYGEDNSSEFYQSILSIIKPLKWKPALINGTKRKEIEIPIIFYIRRYNNPFPLVIEGNSSVTISFKTSYETDEKGNRISKTIKDIISTGKKDSIYYIGVNHQDCSDFDSPAPVGGFDSLRKLAADQIFKRAGISSSKIVKLYFNKTGEIDSVRYSTYMQALVYNFTTDVQKLNWTPAKKTGQKIRGKLSLPIVYYLSDWMDVYPIIVEIVKCGSL